VHCQATYLGTVAEAGEGEREGGREGVRGGPTQADLMNDTDGSWDGTRVGRHERRERRGGRERGGREDVPSELAAGDREPIPGKDVVLAYVVLELLARAAREDPVLEGREGGKSRGKEDKGKEQVSNMQSASAGQGEN
jgi:hypothetical protein